MKKIMPFIICSLTSFLFGLFFYNQYNKNESIPVFLDNKTKITVIQLGVYSNAENMEKNTKDFNYYIYETIEDKYYAYVGITQNNENVEKLKGYYKDLGYIVYSKEKEIKNTNFYEELIKYDELLKNTNDKKAIQTIINQVLNKYEEMNIKV